MRQWYYISNDKTRGPIPEDKFILLFRQNTLTPETLVWTEPMQDWIPACQTDILKYPASAPLPSNTPHSEPAQNPDLDFRDAAARESMRIIEANDGNIPEFYSLCLPVPNAKPSSMRKFGFWNLFPLLAAFLGLAIGAILATLTDNPKFQDYTPGLMVLACCASLAGFLCLITHSSFHRHFTRKAIGTRYNDLAIKGNNSKPICVGIENPDTFHRFKLAPEDAGYLIFEPQACMLIIEGICFRYLIRKDDITAIKEVRLSAGFGTVLSYTIGNITLEVALQHASIRHEFKRQLFGAKRGPLFKKIQDTLQLDQ
jgi:hypothetical protein